ncbi:MAG TPA: 30S ribosomal protein S6 [Ignavibacteriaceae bacterium]|nr:30S ribosomal protein S6 [Ignavibacteriaceae bacterium]
MKMNAYESAVIINAALDDEQINSEIARIRETITNNGGEISDFENWGRKRLAYVINKSKIGYYAIFRFNAPSTIISKLERFYSLNENIIRFLTINLSKEALEYIEKNKVNRIELAETEIAEEKEVPTIIEKTEDESKDEK